MSVEIVKPRIRGFICTNAHPVGCHQNVQNQVNYIKANATTKQSNPNVLVVGASTGYGLASRISLTWALRREIARDFLRTTGIWKTDRHSRLL